MDADPPEIRGRPARAGKRSARAAVRSIGVVGAARWKGNAGNRGRPVSVGGRDFERRFWRRTGRESDRATVPSKPGNSGGGKGPDFRHAFEGGEVGVIDDES